MTTTIGPNARLIDAYLPTYDFSRVERREIEAPPAAVFDAVRHLDCLMIHSPITDLALFVRNLPEKLAGPRPGEQPATPPMPQFMLSTLFDGRTPEQDSLVGAWVGIAEHPGRALVFGAVGKPWLARVEWKRVLSDELAEFDEPGWAKLVASLSVESVDTHRSVLTYEARTKTTDTDSLIRFNRYWIAISPFVGAIMRSLLRTVDQAVDGYRGQAAS